MYHHTFFPFLPGIFGWIILVFLLFPYFLPTIVAFARRKDNAGGVFVLNSFLGWTLIGWVDFAWYGLSSDNQTTHGDRQQYKPGLSA